MLRTKIPRSHFNLDWMGIREGWIQEAIMLMSIGQKCCQLTIVTEGYSIN